MKIELAHKDLVSLVNGTTPHYGVFNHPLVKQCGTYHGGFSDSWDWNSYELEELTEEQLYGLYKLCKDETLNYQEEITEEFPITDEQRLQAPEFKTLEEMVNWELGTQITNNIVGTLNKLK